MAVAVSFARLTARPHFRATAASPPTLTVLASFDTDANTAALQSFAASPVTADVKSSCIAPDPFEGNATGPPPPPVHRDRLRSSFGTSTQNIQRCLLSWWRRFGAESAAEEGTGVQLRAGLGVLIVRVALV